MKEDKVLGEDEARMLDTDGDTEEMVRRRKAEDLLNNPEIFELITIKEFDKKIESELENRQTIFLMGCGAYVENHQVASYNLAVNSDSGAGKDYVANNVLDIFPKKMVEKRTRISEKAFTYWHDSKFEPEWTWDGKICYLQDIADNVLNGDVFKVMVSDGSYSAVVIDQRTVDKKIEGKPVMVVTTANSSPRSEMLRRFPIINMDESKKQTEAIKKRQAKSAVLGAIPENRYSDYVTEALGLLQRVKVKVPFADMLVRAFPSEHIIMRTHFQRLLDLIKASAALHQYQRKEDNDGYIIAEPDDYRIAAIALRTTTKNALMIPLTKKEQKFLEMCKNLPEWFTATQASNACNFLNNTSIYNYLNKLQENFFEVDSRDIDNSKKPVKVYRLKAAVSISIPSYEECQNIKIDVIDGNVRNDVIDVIDNNSNNSINSSSNLCYKCKSTEGLVKIEDPFDPEHKAFWICPRCQSEE